MKKQVIVEGMSCNGCANSVKHKFSALEGVHSVTVDLETKTVEIDSQTDIEDARLKEALADTNYSVQV